MRQVILKALLILEGSNIHEAPAIIRAESTAYINYVADVDKRLVVLLNLDGILSEAEKGALEKVASEAQG